MSHIGGAQNGRELTMCFKGALEGDESTFGQLCTMVGRGLKSDGKGPAHDSFLRSTRWSLYPKLFNELDTNSDGKVDDRDTPTNVNLIGYSWGAVAAKEIAQHLKNDDRVSPERKSVSKLVAIDAFQPFGEMRVPSNVERFRSYRQTNSKDETKNFFFGPYHGIRPVCSVATECQDFDLTIQPALKSPVSGVKASFPGEQVEHVTIPRHVFSPLKEFMFGQREYPVGAVIPVRHYDDE
jgi:hypothetical protein